MNPGASLMGMQISTESMEIRMQFHHKTKNKHAISSNYTLTGYILKEIESAYVYSHVYHSSIHNSQDME
jgi:hypothetical protein